MNSLEQLYYVIGKLETIKEITVNFDDLSFIFEVLEDNEYFHPELLFQSLFHLRLTSHEFAQSLYISPLLL